MRSSRSPPGRAIEESVAALATAYSGEWDDVTITSPAPERSWPGAHRVHAVTVSGVEGGERRSQSVTVYQVEGS